MQTEVKSIIEKALRENLQQRGVVLAEILDDTEFVDDLGLSSVTLFELVLDLEDEFGFDPFTDTDVSLSDMRTFGSLCAVYQRRVADSEQV